MPSSSLSLSQDQLDEMETFLRDWLRHSGRTQADLRRALRATSIRMPVLLEELHGLHQRQGLLALAERLCGIEAIWKVEEGGEPRGRSRGAEAEVALDQLDLLLEEIRLES